MDEKTILLVEDNPSDIKLTQRALLKSHIANKLIVIEDGLEAIDYLFSTGKYEGQNVTGLPTLVLLDIKLPKLDGHEVLQQIRSNPKTHRLPVVMLSSSNEEQDIAACYDLGANSYIRKPVDFEQFIRVVQQLGLYWLILNEKPPVKRIS